MDGRAPADFPKTAKLLSFTGKATQEGLSNAQQQPFVAELEALLEDAASKNADAVKDLLPTLRFLSDGSRRRGEACGTTSPKAAACGF